MGKSLVATFIGLTRSTNLFGCHLQLLFHLAHGAEASLMSDRANGNNSRNVEIVHDRLSFPTGQQKGRSVQRE